MASVVFPSGIKHLTINQPLLNSPLPSSKIILFLDWNVNLLFSSSDATTKLFPSANGVYLQFVVFVIITWTVYLLCKNAIIIIHYKRFAKIFAGKKFNIKTNFTNPFGRKWFFLNPHKF